MKNIAMQWGNDQPTLYVQTVSAMPGLGSGPGSAYLCRHHSPATDWKP